MPNFFFTQPLWTPDTLAALASKLKSNFDFKAVIPSFLFIKQQTLTTIQCYNGICKRNHAPMFETIDEDKDNSWSLSNSSHFKPDALHLRLFTAAYGFKGCPVRLLYSLSSFFSGYAYRRSPRSPWPSSEYHILLYSCLPFTDGEQLKREKMSLWKECQS